jgi:hypothetical protein
MLPEAVERERDSLAVAAIDTLRKAGYKHFRANALVGYPEPEPLLIPVLNVPMTPDIVAYKDDPKDFVIGLVEVSSDLGEELCGRRWQAFAHWIERNGGRLQVFVHHEDVGRAQQIVRHWQLAADSIYAVARQHAQDSPGMR